MLQMFRLHKACGGMIFLLLMHPFAKKELTLPSHKVLIKKLQL